ncbi:nitrate- and nitrite sensing domain-containing protein [Plantactinospora sp. S1510]|uniref:histidine kinase n=1 Tax=Plantactinospora alkalitolerans TaxID=2789879 RepID=A0ABS0GSF1_9ACTN|nr:nitrate- and nitrite sensing domain-containing protein [Plantactinospora alkalitolerans]MBF9129123.1 nitrate- and nitrite sensing domain-containing protein [Plantactinospora alkalitolerans]
MLLDRLRIRGRLALLVVIPLLSTIGLAVPVLVDRIDSARNAADTADSVRRAGRVGTLVQELQLERLLSIGYLLNAVDRSELVTQTAQVGDRLADLRLELGDESTPEIETALGSVQRLTDLRLGVLAKRISPDEVVNGFGHTNNTLIESLRLTRTADGNTPEGRQMIALDAVLRTDEAISAAGTLIVLVVGTNSASAGTAYVANMSRLQSNLARFRGFATPAQNELYGLVERAVAARTSPEFLSVGSLNPTSAVIGLSLDRLFPAVSSLTTLGQFIEKKIVTDVIAEVSDQRQRAIAGAYTVGLLVLLIIALMMLLSLAVARTVARPLTRLTVSADRMARVAEAELVRIVDDESESPDPIRLDPVDVRGRDEIGDLARAFERVQGTAARLVERQAASRRNVAQMFGHVGRRTQNLVGRQIALIDRLEHQETDPGRLQHLYRLDHISSRLRRNASSLVVLSGGAGGDGHVAPLPLGDVVRLALGEIEDYTRVDVQVRLDVAVAPGVIGDLVLTLAELMENATAFSPPHTRVTVLAEVMPGGVRLNLVDHGIGMSPERMAEENARLTRRERLDLVPTEVLGLFVVGRLARRHGWRVTLSGTTPGGGVTVGVEIDDQLLITRHPEAPVVAARAPVTQPLPVRPVSAPEGGPPMAPVPGRLPVENPIMRPDTAPRPSQMPMAPIPELVPAAASTAPVFDAELISRATRSLASGRPWNAFLTRPSSGTGADVPDQPATAPHGDGPDHPEARDLGRRPDAPGQADVPDRPDASDRPDTSNRPDHSGQRNGAPGQPASGGPAAGTADSGPGPAASGPGTGLRQRVPGAQLPVTGRKSRPEPTPADPSVVRASIEEFEAGVRRAQREQQSRPPARRPTPGYEASRLEPEGPRPAQAEVRVEHGDPQSGARATPGDPQSGTRATPGDPHPDQGGSRTDPGGSRPDPGSPAPPESRGSQREQADLRPAPTAARANGVGAAAPAGTGSAAAPPQLNRRVPGANLSIPAPATPHGQAPPTTATATPDDPDRVRELIMQFESGVARALNEVRSDNRHEEGTPR